MSKRFVLWALVGATILSGQPPTARVKGKIVDDEGKPVGGAQIHYMRLPDGVRGPNGRWIQSPGQPSIASRVTAALDGSYGVSGLPSGSYVFCVTAPNHLRSCEWAAWSRVSLAPAADVDFGTLRLTRATTTSIRIDDPSLLLETGANIPLVVGVRDKWDQFHPARRVTKDRSGCLFEVDVPYGHPLQLWLHSWKFRLVDSNGMSVANRAVRIAFQVFQNGKGPTFSFTIAGLNSGAAHERGVN